MRYFLALLPFLLGGCYFVEQARGQICVLRNSESLETLLQSRDVPAETRRKLRQVVRIKEFGVRRMGLTPTDNYSTYFDTGGRPITWLVSACAKDRFEPYTWWFPIVGTVPYKGYFAKEDAQALADALRREGYDVMIGPVAAYSTLGWFTDPILSTMLDEPEEELAALILHEMTHGTIWLTNGVDFNESLAEFAGRQGALEYMRERHGIDSPEYARAVRAFAREEAADRRAREIFLGLNTLYRSNTSRETKLRLRDAIAGLRVNNAALLMRRRYGRYDAFRSLFEEVRGSWTRFFMAASQIGQMPVAAAPPAE